MVAELTTHRGGCHCGRVRFEVRAPVDPDVVECNCSMCSRVGFLHLVVSRDQFKLLQGNECLTTYTFNTGVAKHFFCKICGVKSFYVPRSHPDGYSVNLRCIDPETIGKVTIKPFNGREWEKHIKDLTPGTASSE